MITNKQLDRICDLLVDYRKAIVELTTAAPEDRMAAAYEFAAIDQMVHEMLSSWVEQEETKTEDGGWIEWRGDDKPSDFEYPLPCNTRVEVKSCAGRTYSGCVGEFIWDSGIIAYRVVSYPAI